MTVQELTPEQYRELCQDYICRFWSDYEHKTAGPSLGELAAADEIIDRTIIENYYNGIHFTPDDFFCTAAQSKTLLLYTITGPNTYSEQWLTAEEAADPFYKEHGLTVTPKHEKQEAEK